jgi:hypothetical protein
MHPGDPGPEVAESGLQGSEVQGSKVGYSSHKDLWPDENGESLIP